MQWRGWVIGLASIFIRAAHAMTGEVPVVSVEYGGEVVLPCNSTLVVACYIQPPPGSAMAAFVDGYGHNGTAAAHNTTHCTCKLPAADAEAPVDVSFWEGDSSKPCAPARRLQYVALWTAAIEKRPYLDSDKSGHLVIGIHPSVEGATISMKVESTGVALLKDVGIKSGVAQILQFSLAQLPEDVHLLPLIVTFKPASGEVSKKIVFFSRVRSPSEAVGSFVQVDYSRKALLVNGKPLLGVGYYDSQSIGPSNFTRQSDAGINWGMRYLLSNSPVSKKPRMDNTFIKEYLDWSHANGMYVMFDVFDYFEDLAKHGNSSELWKNITNQVSLVHNHPALLGYYICDDCTTQYLQRQETAKTPTIDHLYQALKRLDPYHPIIGAEECANAYTFTTRNARVPAPSLDVVMFENYVNSLSGNAHTGGISSPGMDGSFAAWPLTWEPIINCPGPWLVAGRKDLSDQQKALTMYSMLWLSAVLANLPMQLLFRLFPFPSHPIYEQILLQVGRYAKVAGKVQDYLLAPPTGMIEPYLSSGQIGDCRQCARIWRRPGNSFCALAVVVNTVNETATASFDLRNAEHWPDARSAALRRIDGSGQAIFQQGIMTVSLEPFDTHVYLTDCDSPEQLVV